MTNQENPSDNSRFNEVSEYGAANTTDARPTNEQACEAVKLSLRGGAVRTNLLQQTPCIAPVPFGHDMGHDLSHHTSLPGKLMWRTPASTIAARVGARSQKTPVHHRTRRLLCSATRGRFGKLTRGLAQLPSWKARSPSNVDSSPAPSSRCLAFSPTSVGGSSTPADRSPTLSGFQRLLLWLVQLLANSPNEIGRSDSRQVSRVPEKQGGNGSVHACAAWPSWLAHCLDSADFLRTCPIDYGT